MKKKLTLNQTWILCIRMWAWIVSEWKKLERKPHDVEKWVNNKKQQWLEENDPENRYIRCYCYFCEYANRHTTIRKYGCINDKLCPGTKVDSNFECYDAGWASDPPGFLKKLRQLNKKRK